MTAPGEAYELAEDIHRLTHEIETHREAMRTAAQERAKLVRILNDLGLGYGEIAKFLGISKGRVQQIVGRQDGDTP